MITKYTTWLYIFLIKIFIKNSLNIFLPLLNINNFSLISYYFLALLIVLHFLKVIILDNTIKCDLLNDGILDIKSNNHWHIALLIKDVSSFNIIPFNGKNQNGLELNKILASDQKQNDLYL